MTVGLIGLLVHCAAMFATTAMLAVPGSEPVVAVINALGWGSLGLFVVPGGPLVVGLRQQEPWAWIVLAAALTAVGCAMYSGSSLSTPRPHRRHDHVAGPHRGCARSWCRPVPTRQIHTLAVGLKPVRFLLVWLLFNHQDRRGSCWLSSK